ncbi:kinesin-like protein KIF14 isoform X2 [Bombus vosnesenskii]|uniref:Kinesin-like protein KIF14 isoform X2 n=1 Tax=Bombus vosnesenskii TaxID=207650 RepID=A0A6J3JR44_9HYME|nr:kinesin-like protein KIF14 isoform X2 [Bombus vosnesenskii]
MSHNTLKSMGHGFCDAIFSSSPINFDKENINSLNEKEGTCSDILDTPQRGVQNVTENKCLKLEKRKILLDNDTENLKSTNIPYTINLSHSKSINTFQRKQVLFPEYAASDSKYKTSTKTMSTTSLNEKTLTMHSCTPKQYKIHTTTSNSKINILPPNKTPVKRYFSDNILSQATPDCFNVVQVETPCGKSNDIGIEDQTVYEGENSNLTVGIRVRPLNTKELNDSKVISVVQVNGQNIIVTCESVQHTFTYDHCFISQIDASEPSYANQEIVFKNMVLPLVQNAFEGYNVCLFAYGQTGSGKSYSMMGQESAQNNIIPLDEAIGIIPRFCQEIFTRASINTNTKTTVEISYFEIYNEKIHDLLTNVNSGVKRAPLKVREHPVFGPYIVDLSQHCVQNYKDLQTWLKVGNSQRATAATGMNEKSSRSHSIFSIILTQTQKNNQLNNESVDASRRSKINLVDLAGSERLSQTCASGDRLKEGVSINKSLLTLGKVIASLAENTSNRKRGFVPYRESVLTWLLKESLGGNSRTAMLGTVSPANIHIEETLATLRYACQARAIVNRVRINEDPHEKLIRELKAEVLRLRGVREGYEKQLGILPRRLLDSVPPVNQNNDEIKQKQQEIDKLRHQLKKTEEQLAITEITIENNNGKLILSSEMEGDTFVNGQVVTGKVILKHGDRLVIGGNHYFKVSSPYDEHSNIQISAQAVDYEFAHQEILKVQEEKLRAELEESKQKAIKELENAKREVEMQLGSQKLSYERKIEILGSTVQEQKLALEQIHQKKKELELEKELLENEVETNNRLKQIQIDQKKVSVAPYKSNFLQELESILNERAADAEFALKMKASAEAISDGGISLHEMQILVKEATERCREVGLNYEFDQQQIIVNKSLKPVVRIRNRDSMRETFWQPMRFLDWVHRLRDYDIEDSIKELCTSEETWEPYENTETFEDSLNNSRISINITPVKKHLNESLQQLSLDTSILGSTLINQTFDISKDQETINTCLVQMELATRTLRKLCTRNGGIQSVAESLDNMQSIICSLREILEIEDINKYSNESVTPMQSFNNSVIEDSDTNLAVSKNYNIKSVSLTKSTLRNSINGFDKKSVRFNDKLQQELT